MKKIVCLLLVFCMVVSLSACSKVGGDQEQPEISQSVAKYATGADDWSQDLVAPKMREVIQIISNSVISGSSGSATDIWLTARPTATVDDEITLDDCNIAMMFINLLESMRNSENEPVDPLANLGSGTMPWADSNELANLVGFEDAGAMRDAGVGTQDLLSYILSSTFGDTSLSSTVDIADLDDFAPQFSTFFEHWYFEEEGDSEIVYDKDGVIIFRNDEHAILAIDDDLGRAIPFQRGDDLYYIAVSGANGYTSFGEITLSAYLYETLEDGTYWNKSLSIYGDWGALLDAADANGGYIRESSQVVTLKVPMLVVSEQVLLSGVVSFDELCSGLTDEFDWWQFNTDDVDEEIMMPEEQSELQKLAEYLGIKYEVLSDGLSL